MSIQTVTKDEDVEYAALATGRKIIGWRNWHFCRAMLEDEEQWNPKEVNKQAFELQVELELNVSVVKSRDSYYASCEGFIPGTGQYVRHREELADHPDKYAMTRVAITKVAAMIGKKMEVTLEQNT